MHSGIGRISPKFAVNVLVPGSDGECNASAPVRHFILSIKIKSGCHIQDVLKDALVAIYSAEYPCVFVKSVVAAQSVIQHIIAHLQILSVSFHLLKFRRNTVDIAVTRTLDFRGWRNTFPTFVKGGGYGTLMWIRLYFAVIGLAYMLPSDVCLSVGFSPFVFFTIFGYFIEFGLPLRTGPLFSPRPDWGMVFGAYIGFFAVLLYTGRHYTLQTLRSAFGRRAGDEIDRESIWGMRVFMLGIIGFVIGVTLGGLDL